MPEPAILSIVFDDERHTGDFIRLNEKWISEHFSIEEADRKLAEKTFKIVTDGGHIITLLIEGVVKGVCALFKEGGHCYQLARMAVEPSERGKGYGTLLIQAALERARTDGATRVYLLSNTLLSSAIALYRKHGFRVVSEGKHPIYARCNIVMEIRW